MDSDIPPDTSTVEALAQALRQDHVIVSRAMGSGAAQESHDRIEALASQLPFETYVALVPIPADAGSGSDATRDLARALARRIGTEGLYVVATTEGPAEAISTVPGVDPDLFSLTESANGHAVLEAANTQGLLEPGVWAEVAVATAAEPIPEPSGTDYPPNLADETAAELARHQQSLQLPLRQRASTAGNDDGRLWEAGGGLMIFLALFFGVGGIVQQLIARSLGRRPQAAVAPISARPPKDTKPSKAAEIRHKAEQRHNQLGKLLGRVAERPDPQTLDLANAAALAKDAAGQLLEATEDSATSAVADLAGALSLARTGVQDARRALGIERSPYRCCFFNPLHQPGSEEAAWQLGEAEVSIPVCRACLRDLRIGRAPDTFRDEDGRPYYEGRGPWARTGYGCLVDDYAARVLAHRGSR